MAVLATKLKEVLYAVLPITFIVLVLNFTVAPLESHMLWKFLLGAAFVIVGLSIFLFGAEIGVGQVGSLLGSALTKTNKAWIVAASGFGLGFLISIAEPDLHILAGQVESVTSGMVSRWGIVMSVSLGIGVLIAFGLLRIVYNVPLRNLFAIGYGVIFVLAAFSSSEFVAIAFDASGATTGAMTVPFLLALGLGVAALKGSASEEDSFGLSGVASAGAIMGVLLMSLLSPPATLKGSLPGGGEVTSIFASYAHELPVVAYEVFLALSPLVALFLVFQARSFKLTRRAFARIIKGLGYTFFGLVLFLTGVNAGFMEVGSVVGHSVASLGNKWLPIVVGFILGMVVILAEPAVHVLNRQAEDVTSGYIRGNLIVIALSLGVALAVALSMARIMVPGLQLWHFLLPGYVISIALMFFVPNLFVGIAFDAGGVASGPMTATFILAFAQGVAEATPGADVLRDGFGIIAMVAMAPLIALQILGFIYKIKSAKGGMKSVDS